MITKRIKIAVVIFILLLISVVFTGFNFTMFAKVRRVDVLLIFTSGALTGVLISLLGEIFFEKKNTQEN